MLAAALFVSTAAAAQDAPLVLEPSSAWHVDYADDSCRLSRTFGEGGNAVVAAMERSEPGDVFELAVAGPSLSIYDPPEARYRFGPNGSNTQRFSDVGTFGAFAPALIADQAALAGGANVVTQGTAQPRGQPAASPTPTSQQPGGSGHVSSTTVTWLEVGSPGRTAVRLAQGPMAEPMAALSACTDDLIAEWGLDVVAHRSLTRKATPANFIGNWMTDRDRPAGLLARGEHAVVRFRLIVDTAGKPTACHVQKSDVAEPFKTVTCKMLMRRARFKPALDSDGAPVVSYFRSAVRFTG